jgi:hypothetical protein
MPKLTDLVTQRVPHEGNDDECPRCQHRKATIYVQGRAMRNISTDPAKHSPSGRTSIGFKSTKGVKFCRTCASEVIGQIAQLLGTEVRDGEAH